MSSTSTTPASEAPTAREGDPITFRLSVRRWVRTCILALFLGCLLLGSAMYAYLQWGWFESDYLGQTLHVRRMYTQGPRYTARRAFGLFPRAQGLLREPFTHNAWKISSVDGYTLYDQKPSWWAVPLSQIPPQVRQVFLFREDRRFYQHAGVDPRALLRATIKTLLGHKQGASTVAMQVAKHCLLDYGEMPASTGLRGILRKLHTIPFAWRLVKVEGRDRVLAYYLNHADMGPGLHGIGPAAWDYFRKKPHELSVGEAAQIAVLLPTPSLDPRHPQHRARYEVKRKALLRQLYDAGMIDGPSYRQSRRLPQLYPRMQHEAAISAPESVASAFRAIDPILSRFDLRDSPQQLRRQPPFPLHVRVSLHAQLSWDFYQAMAPVSQTDGLRYAVIFIVDGRPAILLGGELDLYHYAFQARRQVGSVSKLFFYETVWQLGYVQPNTVVRGGDLPDPIRRRLGRPVYRPRNDDGRIRRSLTHHQSLSRSVNKIAYRTTWGERTDRQRRAMTRVLVNRFRFPWHRTTQSRMAHFYNAFTSDESVALGTWAATPFEVASMLEKGFRGVSLARHHLILSWNDIPMAPPVASSAPGLSRELFRALRDAVAATAPAAVVPESPLTLAAKTGTTDGGRDAWFAGFVLPARHLRQDRIRPRITFVAWAGYDNNRPAGLYGGHVHGPVFRRFLQDSRVQAVLQDFFQRRP